MIMIGRTTIMINDNENGITYDGFNSRTIMGNL